MGYLAEQAEVEIKLALRILSDDPHRAAELLRLAAVKLDGVVELAAVPHE